MRRFELELLLCAVSSVKMVGGDQHGSTCVNMGGGCRAARGLQYIDYLPDQWSILLHSKPPTARILSLTHPLTYYMYLTRGTHITALP